MLFQAFCCLKLQHARVSGGSEEGRASPAMLLLAHGTATEPSTARRGG